MESYITGIGGILFRSDDPQKTRDWYAAHFGLKSESWGAVFSWATGEGDTNPGSTAWAPFPRSTEYFGSSGQEFMVNYRVRNLKELLEKLEAAGVKQERPMESSEFGSFAWITDADGRRIELWEAAE